MRNLFELLDFRARFDPDAVAAQRPDRGLTFVQLRRLAKAIARKLRRAGVRPGQVVATAFEDKGTDWAVTLALFHEATVSCSLGGYTPWRASFPYDWLVTDRNWQGARDANVILLDDGRLDQQDLDSFDRCDDAAEDSTCRLFLTSGTTGQSKGVGLNLPQLLGRARASMLLPGGGRLLGTLGFATASEFNVALVNLMVGSPHFVFPMGQVAALARAYGVDCVTGSPSTLAPLVKQAAASGQKLQGVRTVRVVGAAAAPSLVQALHAHTAAQVVNYYGSTEAGGISAVRATAEAGQGFAQVDATIEIVDEEDRPLPANTEGRVRTRTPFMASGYWQDEAETARAFRGGWFHPGDRGFLRDDGALVLAGREGEILNIGGLKVNPAAIDQAVAEQPGVRDAAVVAAKGALGADRVVVCLVADDAADTAAISEMIRARFGGGCVPSAYVRLAEVPRNAMGKVMRAELAQQLAAGALKPV